MVKKSRSKKTGILLLVISIVLFSVGSYFSVYQLSQGGEEGVHGMIIVLLWTLAFGIAPFIAGIYILLRKRQG